LGQALWHTSLEGLKQQSCLKLSQETVIISNHGEKHVILTNKHIIVAILNFAKLQQTSSCNIVLLKQPILLIQLLLELPPSHREKLGA
jgi:hypothetical protein